MFIFFEVVDKERGARFVMTYFQHNQFMQQDMSFHVGDGNADHDHQRAAHIPLRPCLDG